jgi:hypothetical protein
MMPRAIKPVKKINTAFTLDPQVIEIIDRERGDVSRSEWVNDLILDVFEN